MHHNESHENTTGGLPPRRRRYERSVAPAVAGTTPLQLAMLEAFAALDAAKTSQAAMLCGISVKSARYHARNLFDAGLLDIVPLPPGTLADPAVFGTLSAAYGSSPNVYMPTAAGYRALAKAGIAEIPRAQRVRPRGTRYWRHELFVKDIRIYFEVAARECDSHELARWVSGDAAEIVIGESPRRCLRPDAWCIYGIGARVLAGLIECDMGSERGKLRWGQKAEGYARLFKSDRLKGAVGYRNARVLVFTPDTCVDRIAGLIEAHCPPEIARRFWIAGQSVLANPDLSACVWRQCGQSGLVPLVPAELEITTEAQVPAR